MCYKCVNWQGENADEFGDNYITFLPMISFFVFYF